MKQRVIALCGVLVILLCSTACRIRVDLTDNARPEETPTTTTKPQPETNDEMAAEAWQIYSDALKAEEAYTTYELVYEGRQRVMRETAVTNARIVRVERDGALSLLIEIKQGGKQSRGYFADGIGYFDMEGKKYWMPTEEDAVYETMGLSETENLGESMFAKALVMRNTDGSTTVSCPLDGNNASQFARMYLGDIAIGGTVTRAETGVTVDETGAPVVFNTAVSVNTTLYGTVTLESENRYTAVGEAVVLTPPNDLDTYSSIIE